MGVLRDFDLNNFISTYDCRYLVETGAGTGTGINWARNFPFEAIYSCDIDIDQANHLNEVIGKKDHRIRVIPLDSKTFLEMILKEIKANAVFFLDAHFPGADLGKATFESEPNLDLRLPLETELNILWEQRKGFKDVIIIDDLRVYEKCPMQGGDLAAVGLGHLMKPGTQFLDRWNDTHNVEKLYKNTGYCLLTPKK